MDIGVAYASPNKQVWLHVSLPEGSTAQDAITKSGIVLLFPEIDLASHKIGIYGKLAKLDAVLSDGDRVEIYRPITADPATVPRRDKQDIGSDP